MKEAAGHTTVLLVRQIGVQCGGVGLSPTPKIPTDCRKPLLQSRGMYLIINSITCFCSFSSLLIEKL